jgi:plasmid stabilization system protein ParE
MAFRFLEAVESTLASLRSMPTKGSPKNLRSATLRNVRSWAVRGFPNHLIFYDVRPDHVFVYAVVHGSRRYAQVLKERS